MKKYGKSILAALGCTLIVICLNFVLPRLLPGDAVAYLTGYAEEDMTPEKYEYYENALHLNEPLPAQFLYYLRSLVDGTLGYSYKKEATVASLIGEKIGYTLQITLPAVILSAGLGLVLGLHCGYRRGGALDRLFSGSMIVLNAVPSFVLGLVLMILFCFKIKLLPYTGLSSPGAESFFLDRLKHLALPVLTLTLAALPSRFLLMRNTARKAAEEKYVLYAKERGLSPNRIKYSYIFPNIAQPFITMVGMSVSLCVGGSLVIENIFSIGGMGGLLQDSVYTLDYPLMQGILFITTLIMALSIVITDCLCILIDPRQRRGEG